MNLENKNISSIRDFLIEQGLYLRLTQKADRVIYQAHADIDLVVEEVPDEEIRDELKLVLGSIFEISVSRPEYCSGSGYVPEYNIPVAPFLPNLKLRLEHLVNRGVLNRAYIYDEDNNSINIYGISFKYNTIKLKERQLRSPSVIEVAKNMYLSNLSGVELYPELFKFLIDGGIEINTKKIQAFNEQDLDSSEESDSSIINHINLRQLMMFWANNRHIKFGYEPATGELYTNMSYYTYYPETWSEITYKGSPFITTEAMDYKLWMFMTLLNYTFWNFDPQFIKFLSIIEAPAQQQSSRGLSSDLEQATSFNEFKKRTNILNEELTAIHLPKQNGNEKLNLREIRGGEAFLDTLYATPVTPLQARDMVALFKVGWGKTEHEEINRLRQLLSSSKLTDYLLESLPLYNDYVFKMSDSEEGRLSLGNRLFEAKYSRGEVVFALRYAFKYEFPLISTFIQWLNRNDKSLLSRLLNKMEAHVLLERVCRRFIADNPGEPVFPIITIEPAYRILTIRDAVDNAGGAISKEIEKISGVNPMLYSQPWEGEDWEED